MGKALFFFFWILCSISAYPQGSTGLVAHWDMNGTVNDVSGNGHNGTPNSITVATGEDGLPNTAYYFNGTSSYISVPYSPAFNLTKFSICATLNVAGFYSNYCQGNTVIIRGAILATGSWGLTFDDNAFNDCAVLDTTKEVFNGKAGTNEPSLASDWQYLPGISENKWYKVVMTYDSLSWRIYVNDTLVNTVTGPGYPIGVSTDSVSIGIDLGDSPTYPYQYYGLIDDIELYNIVLTDSEIVHYGDTCGSITLQPANSNISTGGTGGAITYTVSSTIIGATYQWQQNSGTGFVNLSNAGPYSGVTTNTLTVTGVTAAMNNYLYRCLLSNSWGCADTTSSAVLTLGVNNVLNNTTISIYPNPAATELTITCNDRVTNVAIINLLGQTVFSLAYNSEQVRVNVAELRAGIYFVKVNGSEVKKFVKE